MTRVDIDVHALRERLARQLVELGQLRTQTVEEAFRTVPRHVFLPDLPVERVYTNEAFVTRVGPEGHPSSSSSQPEIMAVMLEQLQVQPGDRILEIGAGTGYNAAMLAFLAGSEGAVITIDVDPEVVDEARTHLGHAGYDRVQVVAADGWRGVPDGAPFDRIEVTVGIWDLSPHWVDQLRDGGVLVVPLWLRAGLQASVAFEKRGHSFRALSVAPCGFMRLRGPHAGPERFVTVGEWLFSLDDPTQEEIAILHDLLGEPPRSAEMPGFPQGWFLWVAFEEPGAISCTHARDWRRRRAGIFDPARRGLAVVERDALFAFGDDAAAVRLRERLLQVRPIELRALQIAAIPSAQTIDPEGRWILPRAHFTFVLSPADSAAGA